MPVVNELTKGVAAFPERSSTPSVTIMLIMLSVGKVAVRLTRCPSADRETLGLITVPLTYNAILLLFTVAVLIGSLNVNHMVVPGLTSTALPVGATVTTDGDVPSTSASVVK